MSDNLHDANVGGTRNVLQAARAAGAEALVAAGASAVVMGQPESMIDIRESLPVQYPSWGPYIATKAEAERIVREANQDGFRTVVVRPPLIWGLGRGESRRSWKAPGGSSASNRNRR